MHIKSSPNWDIGAAVRFTESLGYRGLYSIEVNGHAAVRQVYRFWRTSRTSSRRDEDTTMNRRDFLTAAAAAAGMGATGLAQAPAQPPAQGREGGRGGRGGGRGRGGPANVSAEKLARIEIMTLNHSNIIKLPWQEATPQRTLDIFDLPQYYVDMYGVRNVQFQSNHVAQNNDNPELSYIRELRAKLDAAGAKAHQINIEIGTMAQIGAERQGGGALGRCARGLARARKEVGGSSPVLGVTRLMHNQGALTDDSKAGVTSLWKELQDYASPKGHQDFRRDAWQRRTTQGGGQAAPAAPAAAPAMPEPERLRYVWGSSGSAPSGAAATQP